MSRSEIYSALWGLILVALAVQVVGEAEKERKTVNVRTRDNVVHGEHPLESVVQVLQQEKAQRSLESLFGHGRGTDAKAPAPDAAQ